MLHWLLKCTVKKDGRRTVTIDQEKTTITINRLQTIVWKALPLWLSSHAKLHGFLL
jgi:hypothetical protein